MLSVLINHYKSPVALKLCLRSAQAALKELSHEIIVADSAAEPATGRMLRHDFPDARYLPFTRNVGFAKLVNASIREAKGEYFFISNADNIFIDGATEELLAYLETHRDIGIVGPRLEYQNGSHQPSAFRFYTPSVILARRTPYGKTSGGKRTLERFMLRDVLSVPTTNNQLPTTHKDVKPHGLTPVAPVLAVRGSVGRNPAPNAFTNHSSTPLPACRQAGGRWRSGARVKPPLERMEPMPVDWLMGSALVVRRKAADAVGLLDERFFMYFEDVDWCRRFWEKKWGVVWVPAARMVHVHAQASKGRGALFDVVLNPYARIHIKSAVKYFRKHGLKTPRCGI